MPYVTISAEDYIVGFSLGAPVAKASGDLRLHPEGPCRHAHPILKAEVMDLEPLDLRECAPAETEEA